MRYLFCLFILFSQIQTFAKVVVAIDAGHGGIDPGTIGKKLKLKEKDVTLAIATELQKLIDKDKTFTAVMTRTNDVFIPLPERTEIARKNKANYFISIHADSSPTDTTGASVWILSKSRASSEMAKWLEAHEKQTNLLGGTGKILADQNNPAYLNQTVLDLQFSYAKRNSFILGAEILKYLRQVTHLAKAEPMRASLAVLKSPDIISVLVETGFLSNEKEEKLLSTNSYRKKIALQIFKGLKEYHLKNNPIIEQEKQTIHTVKAGETLFQISKKYKINIKKLKELNNLKNNNLEIGQKLIIK